MGGGSGNKAIKGLPSNHKALSSNLSTSKKILGIDKLNLGLSQPRMEEERETEMKEVQLSCLGNLEFNSVNGTSPRQRIREASSRRPHLNEPLKEIFGEELIKNGIISLTPNSASPIFLPCDLGQIASPPCISPYFWVLRRTTLS
jgi:hypothetical protein